MRPKIWAKALSYSYFVPSMFTKKSLVCLAQESILRDVKFCQFERPHLSALALSGQGRMGCYLPFAASGGKFECLADAQ